MCCIKEVHIVPLPIFDSILISIAIYFKRFFGNSDIIFEATVSVISNVKQPQNSVIVSF